ncbi:MAG: hypothetical protein AB3N17_09050, partial [Tateyamaria sp.]
MTYLSSSWAWGTACCGALFSLASDALAQDLRFSPEIAIELTGFPDDPTFDEQFQGFTGAIIATGEVAWRNDARTLQMVVEPYLRYDSRDDERTYTDLRRGFLRYLGDGWDITVGADRVFWGVVESVNVVDVINQRDALEDADLDEKLGQPMLRFSSQTGIGTFDVFYLPYFRERAFPGLESRGRLPFPVDEDAATFERSGEETAGDVALRYANRFGGVDLGLSYFYGTARQPRLDFNPARGVYEPVYQRQRQLGLDIQYTSDAWLLKLEAARVEIGDDQFIAAVGGFEYTFFDVAASGRDVGVIAEYLYDGRNQDQSPVTPFDDDLFFGTRITWNDVEDTELLAGAIIDVNGGCTPISAQANPRVGEKKLVVVQMGGGGANGGPLFAKFEGGTPLVVPLSGAFLKRRGRFPLPFCVSTAPP